MLLEVACFSLQSAITAAQSGAHRIELCQNYASGGVSPELEEFKILRDMISIPIMVMIRPRGGNFIYNSEELDQMAVEMEDFRFNGADGFVYGVLDSNNQIDFSTCKELINFTGELPLTFHRAFDLVSDPVLNAEQLASIGFSRILCSGGKGSARQNLAQLIKLKNELKQISILPGGGIRSNDVEEFKKAGFEEIHSSAITNLDNPMPDPEEIKAFLKAF